MGEPLKMFSEEQLAKMLCILNEIQPDDPLDGSPNWWMFSAQAKRMLTAASAQPKELSPQMLEALALLRELNDALAIPNGFQPRVDALLDRAEEKS